jgi:hypothetical protein
VGGLRFLSVKPAGIVGIILIVVGIIALAYGGFHYTKRVEIIDAGPLQVSAKREKKVSIPPLLGGLCLAGGIALVIVGSRK